MKCRTSLAAVLLALFSPLLHAAAPLTSSLKEQP